MTTYKATTINGEPKLEAVNPYRFTPRTLENAGLILTVEDLENNDHREFAVSNPPILYIGPAIPDGTILDESEVEIKEQFRDTLSRQNNGEWFDVKVRPTQMSDRYETRRVATLKAKEPEKKIATCKYCECPEFTPHGYCSECGNKRDSEEGEQPMKEERPTEEYLINSGWSKRPAPAIIGNSYILDIGRDRYLTLSNIDNPNQMLSVSEIDPETKLIESIIIIHNWDFDGWITINKMENILSVFSYTLTKK